MTNIAKIWLFLYFLQAVQDSHGIVVKCTAAIFLLRRILRLADEKRRSYENALWACVKNLLSGVNLCFSTRCACAEHFAVKLSGWDELEVGISLPRGRISSVI